MNLSKIKYEEQIDQIIHLLANSNGDLIRGSPQYTRCLEWLIKFPVEVSEGKRLELVKQVCISFKVSEGDLLLDAGKEEQNFTEIIPSPWGSEDELYSLLPQGGWFEWYAEYTRRTESPLAYHVAGSFVALGCALGRRCWFPMGHFKIYPNFCTILIGPTAKVSKTSAVDVVERLVTRNALCPIMADKPTPEAMATALKDCGQQFVYAPEFSVFFGKQKYNEGMTVTMLRLLDSPDKYIIKTQTRGEEEVHNVLLNVMGGSTLSLLISSTPGEVLSGGFLNRFVLVIEDETSRIFPIPSKGKGEDRMDQQLKRLQSFSGDFAFSPEAFRVYDNWYRERTFQVRSMDEGAAEAIGRGKVHAVRMACLMHAAQHDDMLICEDCFTRSARILEYFERGIPRLIRSVSQTTVGADHEFILSALQRLGGLSDHSRLLRRCSHRFNAPTFKQAIKTLIESGRVKEVKIGAIHGYQLLKEVR